MKTISFVADETLEQVISDLKRMEMRRSTSDLIRFVLLQRHIFLLKKEAMPKTPPKED